MISGVLTGTDFVHHSRNSELAQTRGPVDRGAAADGFLPLRADLGEVVREAVAGARPVGAVHHRDRQVGELRDRVELGDGLGIGADAFHRHPLDLFDAGDLILDSELGVITSIPFP